MVIGKIKWGTFFFLSFFLSLNIRFAWFFLALGAGAVLLSSFLACINLRYRLIVLAPVALVLCGSLYVLVQYTRTVSGVEQQDTKQQGFLYA